jgi:hypothetical protein
MYGPSGVILEEAGGGGQPGGPIGPVIQGGAGNTPPTSPPQGQ